MLRVRLPRYLDEVSRAGSIGVHADAAESALKRGGRELIAHVRDALRKHERAVARAAAHRERKRGEVTVATVTGLASCMLGAFGARQL